MRVALARKLDGIDRVERAELPDPEPAAGQALVRANGTLASSAVERKRTVKRWKW